MAAKKTKGSSTQGWFEEMRRGQSLHQQGQFKDAVRAFKKATIMMPRRIEGWVNLGVSQVDGGDYEESLVTLRHAMGIEARLMPVHLAMGDALRNLGRWSEAEAAYRNAVALQRAPQALNKLASLLRTGGGQTEAEKLYLEALRYQPDFTTARVNLATLQLELGRLDQAAQMLEGLDRNPLPPPERDEVKSSYIALSEYERLHPSVLRALETSDLEPLYAAIRDTPAAHLQVDEAIKQRLCRYADSASRLPEMPGEATPALLLPAEWPLIEALFMVPLVETVSEYRALVATLHTGRREDTDLHESLNMEPVVLAARAVKDGFRDPVQAETHLRYWHALATRGLPAYLPGHFKLVRNLTRNNVTLQRAAPHHAAGTLRWFLAEIYPRLPVGLPRGIVTLLAILDIHPFADGNGRVALTVLNRELESAGLMPALFTHQKGFNGSLAAVLREVRLQDGKDLDQLAFFISDAQGFAHNFCLELAAL